jgi:hypothetical protein
MAGNVEGSTGLDPVACSDDAANLSAAQASRGAAECHQSSRQYVPLSHEIICTQIIRRTPCLVKAKLRGCGGSSRGVCDAVKVSTHDEVCIITISRDMLQTHKKCGERLPFHRMIVL